MSRKRILLNLPSQPPAKPTGVSRFGFSLAEALARRGKYQYVLRTAYASEQLPETIRNSSIETVTIDFPEFLILDVFRQALTMPAFCRADGIDLILNLDPLGAARGGRKRAMVVHDLYFKAIPDQVRRREIWTTGLVFKLMLWGSDRIIAVSGTTARDVAAHYPEAAGRLGVILSDTTLAIGPDEALPAPEAAQPYVLAVGNATDNKNLGVLARAMTEVARQHPEVGIVHVGDDPNDRFARAFAAAKRDVRLVRLRGIDDRRLAALYRNALCLCTPSLYEGFCLPIVEAQKQGCPVLFSNRSATAEIGGEGGLSFDPTNPDALADLLLRLVREPELRELLKKRGAKNARRFSWDAAAAQYEKIFDELLEG